MNEYEIRSIMEDGKEFGVGGYVKLDRALEVAKKYAPKTLGTSIIYHTSDGDSLVMTLEQAEARLKFLSGVKVFRFSNAN